MEEKVEREKGLRAGKLTSSYSALQVLESTRCMACYGTVTPVTRRDWPSTLELSFFGAVSGCGYSKLAQSSTLPATQALQGTCRPLGVSIFSSTPHTPCTVASRWSKEQPATQARV